MTHAEFHEAVKRLSRGDAYSTTIEATTYGNGKTELRYGCWTMRSRGWHYGASAQLALTALQAMLPIVEPEIEPARLLDSLAPTPEAAE